MLEAKIQNIKNEFVKINSLLENYSGENFDEVISEIESSAKKMNSIKNELTAQYPNSELKKFNVEFQTLIKQINNKFDNIIDGVKLSQAEISKELANLNNQKKITAYNR